MATATLTLAGPPGQPDIAYTPNLETYSARVKKRQETEQLSKTLPPGFPAKLQSDLVWDGATISDHYEWSYELNADQLQEIDEALQHFKGRQSCARRRCTDR